MSDARLICGDCRDVLPTLAEGSVDAVVTDPPYLNGEDGIPMSHDGVAVRVVESASVSNPWGYSLDWVDACAALHPKHWAVFCNYAMLGELHVALSRHARVAAVFVWRKSNAPNMARPVPRMDCEFIIWAKAPGASCGRMREFKSLVLDVPMLQAGCFAYERVVERDSGKAFHPCQKPLRVVQPFIDRLLDPVATYLDPFAGTGTTGVACVRAGHKAILIEQDPRYVAIAERRLADAATPLLDALEAT